ncbi:MAG: S9 family peptidase [Chloroflexi bacterium]|nr:S9 family peptidase [Chloroflexota bacterium]
MARLLGTDDLFRLRWLDDPQESPDGHRIACVVMALDEALDATVSQVLVLDDAGRMLHRLGAANTRSDSPRWSPGGDRLAFVSADGGAERIWLADASTGDTRCLTAAATTATEPAWSPDGRWVAYSAPVDGHRQIGRLPAAGGEPQPVTHGQWQAYAPQFSPDGTRIAFLAQCSTVAPADVWVCSATGGELKRLTAGTGPVRALAWSPDSRSIAYIAHARGPAQGVDFGVWVVPSERGAPRHLTDGFGRSAGLTVRADDSRGTQAPSLCWLPDGIYFVFADGGRSHIGRVSPGEPVQTVIGGDRACLSFSAAAGADVLAFIAAEPLNPGDLHLARHDGTGERALSHANDWLGECALSRPERFTVTASDGQAIDAWLMRPPSLTGAVNPPLILQIHGGPHYPLGERFYFDFQRLAAQGYAVLYVNMRGSQGYGEAFATAIRGAWGERDYLDLLECLDAALAQGGLDGGRLAVTGVSYGGYMTNWIIGHTPRFRAAIGENGISDLQANFATSLHGEEFWNWELGGTPQTMPARYRTLSPVTYAANVQTPLLLVHAENDTNCAIAQSETMANAVRAHGGVALLVRIPGEGHLMNLIGTPEHRQQRMAAIDEWLARWL